MGVQSASLDQILRGIIRTGHRGHQQLLGIAVPSPGLRLGLSHIVHMLNNSLKLIIELITSNGHTIDWQKPIAGMLAHHKLPVFRVGVGSTGAIIGRVNMDAIAVVIFVYHRIVFARFIVIGRFIWG